MGVSLPLLPQIKKSLSLPTRGSPLSAALLEAGPHSSGQLVGILVSLSAVLGLHTLVTTTLGIFTWVLGIERGSSCLQGKYFYQLSYPPPPVLECAF